MLDEGIKLYIGEVYNNNTYDLIIEILDCVYELLGPELNVIIDNHVNNVDYVMPEQDSVYLNTLIAEYVVDNYINSVMGVVLDRDYYPDITFIHHILKLETNIKNMSIVDTSELHSVINNDAVSSTDKLGMMLVTVDPYYHYLDIYNFVSYVPDELITRYNKLLDDIDSIKTNDEVNIKDYTDLILSKDPELFTTNLSKYVMSKYLYNITDKQSLSFINELVSSGKVKDLELAMELAVMCLLLDKDLGYAEDLVDSVYVKHDTSEIMSYLRTVLERSDE